MTRDLHATLEQDRRYASELLADLTSEGENLSRIEKATRWFRKARRENALLSDPARNDRGARSAKKVDTEGLTGRERNPWLCHVTPGEVYTTSNRILDLIQESDPFGDRITQHELRIFSHAFADLGRSQALYRFQHGLDQNNPEQCRVCGGDCASANPPVINCPDCQAGGQRS